MLIMTAAAFAGCMHTRHTADDTAAREPIRLSFSESQSGRDPIRLRSGQLFVPPHCCPPLELRDAEGNTVRKYDETADELLLNVPAGRYALVGHDPAGGEQVLQMEVMQE